MLEKRAGDFNQDNITGIPGEQIAAEWLCTNWNIPEGYEVIHTVVNPGNVGKYKPWLQSSTLGKEYSADIIIGKLNKENNSIIIHETFDAKRRPNPENQDCYLELKIEVETLCRYKNVNGNHSVIPEETIYKLKQEYVDYLLFVLYDGTVCAQLI